MFVIQVAYNTDGWLDKNKDPINETVVQLLQQAKEPLVAVFFAEAAPGRQKRDQCHFLIKQSQIGLYSPS